MPIEEGDDYFSFDCNSGSEYLIRPDSFCH